MNINDKLHELAEKMEANGWTPLVTIATQHGEVICFHIYAAQLHEDKAQDKYAYFRRCENPEFLRNENKFFKSVDESNEYFQCIQILASKIPHVVVDMDKFMDEWREMDVYRAG